MLYISLKIEGAYACKRREMPEGVTDFCNLKAICGYRITFHLTVESRVN